MRVLSVILKTIAVVWGVPLMAFATYWHWDDFWFEVEYWLTSDRAEPEISNKLLDAKDGIELLKPRDLTVSDLRPLTPSPVDQDILIGYLKTEDDESLPAYLFSDEGEDIYQDNTLAGGCGFTLIENMVLASEAYERFALSQNGLVLAHNNIRDDRVKGVVIASVQNDSNDDGYLNCDDGATLTFFDVESGTSTGYGFSFEPESTIFMKHRPGILLMIDQNEDFAGAGKFQYVDLVTQELRPALPADARARIEALKSQPAILNIPAENE